MATNEIETAAASTTISTDTMTVAYTAAVDGVSANSASTSTSEEKSNEEPVQVQPPPGPEKCQAVDLQGYVIIIVQTTDNKVKLYGSPAAGRDNLEVADEIMDVNDTKVEDMSRAEVIDYIHECIQSCLIKLRVRRATEERMQSSDVGQNIVQDAFLIAVEEQARQRLQRLSALKQITPVDMSLLSLELNQKRQPYTKTASPVKKDTSQLNGYVRNSEIYVTTIGKESSTTDTKPTTSSPKTKTKSLESNCKPLLANGIHPSHARIETTQAIIEPIRKKFLEKDENKENVIKNEELKQVIEHINNGRSEKLLGEHPENRLKNCQNSVDHNYLGPNEKGTRRRSGSSIVVLGADEEKRPPSDDDQNMITMYSLSSDNGPHREMAVDVPDSFIARNKTPPRYPPPRPPQVRTRPARDEEPLLSSSGGSGTSFGSKQSTVLNSAADLSGPVSSDDSGSFKTQETSTLELLSGPQSSNGSRTSFGSKKSSKNSSETTKCGDIFSERSASVASNTHTTLNDHIIQLIINNADDSLLDCKNSVLYSAKTDSVLIREAVYATYKLPPGYDTTPVLLGREVAVDVPDSFVHIVKSTPKYPAMADRKSVASYQGVNGSLKGGSSVPAVPPREVTRDAPPRPPTLEPTKEQQLESIKKYYEQLVQRKEAEERIAAHNEFLRTSLRGSAKLQALEANSSPQNAFVNNAYEEDAESDTSQPVPVSFDFSELSTLLAKLQKSFNGNGESALATRVTGAAGILTDPTIQTVLTKRSAILTTMNNGKRQEVSPPYSPKATDRLKDCMYELGDHTTVRSDGSAVAAELLSVLGGLEVENLIQAHDQAANALDIAALNEASAKLNKEMNIVLNHKSDGRMITAQSQEDGSEIKIIKIEKTNEPLGATVRNEGEAVVIGRIVRGGAAEKSGLLHEGDELLEVNGIPMRGKSVHEVCQLLGTLTGTLSMWVVPRPTPPRPPPPNRVLHVRAHFDYDPEDDVYIPCRELGISFQKGDVLHVISREDPNWWQAFREGEEDQTLAGLIPSQAFQHQRESMKVTLAGEAAARDKPRKGGTLLCAKKPPRKKRGKKATSEAGYPLYSTSGGEDYEQEEILTYEEVALYYPRASHKRPIVLIGPPNIGRHELRQRLMEDSARFAAAVPHTSRPRKDHEMPGQDYHFISRTQFEADILNRKFVEHGEYEKAYYGTSLEAIREVVSSGKICVLNLHPQSLKILRSSDLKPYTVFVAPPSLEKLRQKKIRNGEAFKEDELKDIIATARDMELRWGHLFDMIIINNDTQRAYQQLLTEINSLEREPQWVPAHWLKQT